MKKRNSKTAIVSAGLSTDLMLALHWAKLNRVLKSVGSVSFNDKKKKYIVKVRLKRDNTKASLKALLKDRFGIFIDVF